MADDQDQTGPTTMFLPRSEQGPLVAVPLPWHPDGIMAAVPAMNVAASQSTLPAVMSPEQMGDVDWGGEGHDIDPGFNAANDRPVLVAAGDTGANPADGGPQPPVGTAPAKPAGVNWDFITGHETTTGRGYVPQDGDHHPLSGSGATIATGFDLGQHSADDLRSLGLPPDVITQVSPLLAPGPNAQGLLGQAAQDYLTAHPLVITPAQAGQIDSAVANRNYNQVARAYNADQSTGTRFQDLPQEAQTAVMSVAHQYGTNLADATPNFWDQVTSGQWQAAHDNLMKFGDAYKTRRHAEAGLLMNAIDSGNLAAGSNQ